MQARLDFRIYYFFPGGTPHDLRETISLVSCSFKSFEIY
jgi:hypothetical protein